MNSRSYLKVQRCLIKKVLIWTRSDILCNKQDTKTKPNQKKSKQIKKWEKKENKKNNHSSTNLIKTRCMQLQILLAAAVINMQPGEEKKTTQLREESSDYFFLIKFFFIKLFRIISPNFINALLLLHVDIFFLSVPLWVCKTFQPERINSPAFYN